MVAITKYRLQNYELFLKETRKKKKRINVVCFFITKNGVIMVMRYIFGIGLVIIGIGLLLGQLGIINFGDFIFTWWPILIVVMGLSWIFTDKRSGFSGYFVVAFGALLLLNNLDVFEAGFWSIFWSLLLIYIGVTLVFKTKNKRKGEFIKDNKFEVFNVFSENNRVIDSKDFENGEITSVFGSSKIDFTQAEFFNDNAEVEVSITFGSVVFIVPQNMNIKANGFPIFGALENKTQNPSNNPMYKTLNIKYFIAFGSLEIKNN